MKKKPTDPIKPMIQMAFCNLLQEIEENDTNNYERRNLLVLKAMIKAIELGYNAGVRIDPSEPEWPVVYIELPTGQISWHIPQHGKPYDGHTTPQKYERVHEFLRDTIAELDGLVLRHR